MARGKEVTGQCRLCGFVRPLTKEHIPPQSALVSRNLRLWVYRGDAALDGGPAKQYQGGFSERVLCEECNNFCGREYVNDFADWSRWGIRMLRRTSRPPDTLHAENIRPLRVIKQIVAMMLASSPAYFGEAHPELRRFVLAIDARGLSPRYRVYTYFSPGLTGRSTGPTKVWEHDSLLAQSVEIAQPPFGYVLLFDGLIRDRRPTEITWFARCAADETRDITMPLAALPVLEAFPLDWRNQREMRTTVLENLYTEAGHPQPREAAEAYVATEERG